MNVVLPIGVSLAAFLLYLSTLAPGMLRGDSGEFQWAMAALQVAHATGYPLFTLIGHAWLQVPLGVSAAWQLNLLGPFFGACAVGAVFVFVQMVTGRTLAALAAAVMLALSPVLWFNASILEVYPLHIFLLALVLVLLLQWARVPAQWAYLYSAFFVLGLALAHHRLAALALPGILLWMALTDLRGVLNPRRVLVIVAALLPGLLLYLYVPLQLLPTGVSFDYVVEDIILGGEYAGSLLQEFNPVPVLWTIPFDNFHIGLALALIGSIVLFQRDRNLNLALWLIALLDVSFALAYSVPDIQVFLSSALLVMAVWIGAGVDWVIEAVSRIAPARLRRPALAALALAVGILALLGLARYESIKTAVSAEAGTAEQRARQILAAELPTGALLELDWETATALRFIQATEGQRADLEARLIAVNQRGEFENVLNNVDRGRPVYVESGVKWTRAPAGYEAQPDANELSRLVPASQNVKPLDLQLADRVRLSGLAQPPGRLVLLWSLSAPLPGDYATFIHYFDADGNKLGQEDHAACCEAIYGYRTSEWSAGLLWADSYRPPPHGTVYLNVGMYGQANGELEPYGEVLRITLEPITLPGGASRVDATFRDNLTLTGYELRNLGNQWQLDLYWQARGPVKREYAVWLETRAANGAVLERASRAPLEEAFPMRAWPQGQLVRDRHLVNKQNVAAIGVGLWQADNSRRLMLANSDQDSVEISVGTSLSAQNPPAN